MSFTVTIITANKVVYKGQANSAFLPGQTGEFEILPFHKPIISRLKEGRIVLDWAKSIFIKDGAILFSDEHLRAIVREQT